MLCKCATKCTFWWGSVPYMLQYGTHTQYLCLVVQMLQRSIRRSTPCSCHVVQMLQCPVCCSTPCLRLVARVVALCVTSGVYWYGLRLIGQHCVVPATTYVLRVHTLLCVLCNRPAGKRAFATAKPTLAAAAFCSPQSTSRMHETQGIACVVRPSQEMTPPAPPRGGALCCHRSSASRRRSWPWCGS